MKAASRNIGSRMGVAVILETDFVLLQQLEELGTGQTVHRQANLSAAYQSAMNEYKRTGDDAFRQIATEAHLELRRLLTTMREAAFPAVWERFSSC